MHTITLNLPNGRQLLIEKVSALELGGSKVAYRQASEIAAETVDLLRRGDWTVNVTDETGEACWTFEQTAAPTTSVQLLPLLLDLYDSRTTT